MPLLVNGELIPTELIREEERCLAQLPEWQGIPDGIEKAMRLRQVAEWYVIDRVLLRQEADKDPRPIDPAAVATEVQRLWASQSCRAVFDDAPLSRQIEAQLRLQRKVGDRREGLHVLAAQAPEVFRLTRARLRSFSFRVQERTCLI